MDLRAHKVLNERLHSTRMLDRIAVLAIEASANVEGARRLFKHKGTR
jgi:hypothetical protein